MKLPDATAEVFGLVQSFLYTGKIADENTSVTSYESLVSLWNLGHKLAVKGLCEHTLEAMVDCRRTTGRIPATPLLIQVWRDTPEGSSIRVLLLSWAAEYMRSSDARAEFAKSLPQEVLSELVVTMSSFETIALPAAAVAPAVAAVATAAAVSALPPSSIKSSNASVPTAPRKNVHYLDEQPDEEALGAKKKNRRSSGVASDAASARKSHRKSGSSPPPKPQKRRSSAALLEGKTFSTHQKLDFCADLLNRMLSGPGKHYGITINHIHRSVAFN